MIRYRKYVYTPKTSRIKEKEILVDGKAEKDSGQRWK
jgi:hypothetical protein